MTNDQWQITNNKPDGWIKLDDPDDQNEPDWWAEENYILLAHKKRSFFSYKGLGLTPQGDYLISIFWLKQPQHYIFRELQGVCFLIVLNVELINFL